MVASIPRTAVPLWSPYSLPKPLLATGTASGALDASFSSDSLLEIWDPFQSAASSSDDSSSKVELAPLASVTVQSRVNRLAWGYVNGPQRPKGVIAAGFENGEIGLWDPEIILSGQGESLISKYELHKGPVRGLDFNPHSTNLLASGATDGEIYIWDLTTPNKPYSPGTRSRSIDDITTLAWNSHVAHILATGSNSGYTVVWDLKAKREVTALSYNSGGQATGVGNGFGQPGWGGGKRGVSCVQWHPDNPTKLVTASDDDQNPVIMLWDLRNWKEPERLLTGHEKGILSLSWCKQDSDLLLSTGKDGRTLCWNPSSGEIVAEVPPSSNWSFDVQWCPRNPSILSTATLDGKVNIHSIQSTSTPSHAETPAEASLAPGADGANLFDQAISANAANYPTKSLTQTPKWLKRPSSVAFGFGGKMVVVSNEAGSASVTVKSVVGAPGVVSRALRLEEATQKQELANFCEERSSEIKEENKDGEAVNWKLLRTLFGAESRSELVGLLGFSKDEVKAKVEAAIKSMKDKLPKDEFSTGMSKTQSSGAISGQSVGSDLEGGEDSTSVAREPLVTFADTPTDGLSASSEGEAAAATLLGPNHHRAGSATLDGSTTSASGTSDATTKLASEAESEITEPSLFGDESTASTGAAGADFFSQIASGRPSLPEHIFARDAVAGSSVAATVGSASSVASLNLKPTTFKIYPAEESEVDRLITKALVLGDFASAVDLCISTERFADAILLAVRGGVDLLAKTQKSYFESKTLSLPYLRVFQSIVANDLTDVVQNADLSEWQEIFVVLCTFAKGDEFAGLVEQLGVRLEYQYAVVKGSPTPEHAPELRKNAILCYLAAGQLEKVVGIWIQQMQEEEAAHSESGDAGSIQSATSKYDAHSKALQTFVEKVTVFQQAVNYVDVDLAEPTLSSEIAESGARVYKLAALYERYIEYAELLAAQGLVEVAAKFVQQTPLDFDGPKASSGSALTRDRIFRATGSHSRSDVFAGHSRIGQVEAIAPVASTSTAGGYYANDNAAYAQQAYSAPQADPYAQQGGSSWDPRRPSYVQPNQNAIDPRRPSYVPTPRASVVQPSSYSTSAPDDPYGPPAGSSAYGTLPSSGSYAPPSTSAYAPVGQAAYASQQTNAYPSYSQAPSSYSTQVAASPYDRRESFIPAPPIIRESSPNFANRGINSSAPPPPRAKAPEGQWNDAPQLAIRKPTVPAAVTPKPSAITSPFPNSPSAVSSPQTPNYGGFPPSQVPPPPPSRGSNRTPAPAPPPPPMAGRAPPPMPPMGGAPPTGYSGQPPRFPPGPPGQQQQQQQQQQHPAPPPLAGPPRNLQQQQGAFRGAPTPPPGAGIYGRPNPPAPSAYGGPPPPGSQQQRGPPPTPGQYASPPGPQAPQGQGQPGPYGPPAGINRGPPAPPPGYGNGPPPSRFNAASPAPVAPAPPKVEAPKSKYPPGDRTHIPEGQKPIFGVLSNEIKRLRQITPPQQQKMIQDIEKRLNLLFDMLNCETLSESATAKILRIVKAIESHNQPLALETHLEMITSADSSAVSPFQAALKIVIQRMG